MRGFVQQTERYIRASACNSMMSVVNTPIMPVPMSLGPSIWCERSRDKSQDRSWEGSFTTYLHIRISMFPGPSSQASNYCQSSYWGPECGGTAGHHWDAAFTFSDPNCMALSRTIDNEYFKESAITATTLLLTNITRSQRSDILAIVGSKIFGVCGWVDDNWLTIGFKIGCKIGIKFGFKFPKKYIDK